MPTATRAASAELASLEQRLAEVRAAAREAKDAKNAYEAEVHELRVRYAALDPDSPEAQKLRGEIHAREASRIESTGPYAEAYAEARAPFHDLDREVQRFKRENLRARIAEIEADSAAADIVAAHRAVLAAIGRYRAQIVAVRDVVLDTPGFDGQDFGWDGRIEEWERIAADALEGEIAPPSLTAMGEWKADRHD